MKEYRKTKIVATLGPATDSAEMIEALIHQGVNVFRLNFSHGTHQDHLQTLTRIREISKTKNLNVAILQDLQGPKIRIGEVEGGEVQLENGTLFAITTQACIATAERASVSYPYLMEDIEVGSRVLIDDGHMELKVESKNEHELLCRVIHGGPLRPKKGVNFPDASLQIAALSEKDKRDLDFAIEHKVDFVAVSFVQRTADVLETKDFLTSKGAYIPVIAKIERQEAINNIQAIIDIADGVMVARGDLGVEIPTEQVPLAQKKIIALCNEAGKPVITATQMLDSMINSPRPTRAEASDVANAILDGTDAVMLSNETATGKFPLEAVATMHNIALTIESEMAKTMERNPLRQLQAQNIATAVGTAACQMAKYLHATAIITATLGGSITRQVAKHRPSMMVIAATPHEKTWREMNLLWGTYPLRITPSSDTDTLMRTILDQAIQNNLVSQGDTVIMTAGIPAGQPGSTNMIKVETVTKVLAKGMGLGNKLVSGRAILAQTAEEAMSKIQDGDILITSMTTRDYMPLMDRIVGIITTEGGLTSHAAIVGMSLGIPVLLGVADAFEIIREHGQITIDPGQGLIFTGIPNIT
jgi:pyruvate kinase